MAKSSNRSELLKEAIAEAKTVKETAVENAKQTIMEAFAPRIQSMLAKKLSEEDETDEMEGDDELGLGDEEHAEPDGDEASVPEADAMGDEMSAEPDGDEEVKMEGDEEHAEPDGDEATVDTSDAPGGDDAPADDMSDDDAELEEIIRQLEADLHEDANTSEIGKSDNKEPSKAASDESTEDPQGKVMTVKERQERLQNVKKMIESTLASLTEEDMVDDNDGDEDETVEEMVKRLREGDAVAEPDGDEQHSEYKAVAEEAEKELEEAYQTIEFLRSKLNEINLLNSKLLYSNKLFRNYQLDENQKVKVIENFDRTNNIREVKLVYSTLSESFRTSKVRKNPLRESFASSPKGAANSTKPSKNIVDNSSVNRLKELAFYKIDS